MPQSPFTIVSGRSLPQSQLGFVAYGLVVENITNQWYYEPGSRRWIPPYQSGVTVPLHGVQMGELQCLAPASSKQATPIVGEYVTATFADASVAAGAGVPVSGFGGGPAARPVFYGQQFPTGALLSVGMFGFSSNGRGPAIGQVASLTIPAGAVAFVEWASAIIYRDVAPGVAGLVQAFLRYTPIGQLALPIVFTGIPAAETTLNVVHADQAPAPLGWFNPGDVLDWWAVDTSTGGSCTYQLQAKFMFFVTP